MQHRLNWLIFTIVIWPYYWVRMYLWWQWRKQPENQIADIGRLIDLRPDYAPFYLRRASWLGYARKNLEQGFADCETARQVNPALDKTEAVYLIRSQLYHVKGDKDQMLAELDLALKANPASRGVYFLRATVHKSRRNFSLAIADYRAGLTYDFGMNRTEYAETYIKIAKIYLELNENEKALAEFEKAAEYSPTHLDLLHGRIHVHASRGDVAAIDCEISKIPRRKPLNLALALGARGYAYNTQGSHPRAMEDFERALQLKPDHWQLLLNRGMGHLHLGNRDAAMKDMQRAVDIKPTNPYAHNAVGFIHLLRGDFEAARSAINKAIELRPTFEPAYDSRGHLGLLSEDYTSALEDFETAAKGRPDKSTRISAMAGQAVAHYALNDADNIDTAVALWRALCERHADRDLLVYLREQTLWPSRSLELAAQLNALVFP